MEYTKIQDGMNSDPVAQSLFRLIEVGYPSDAAFERAAGLPPKTVSNWRRGRSATYLKQLPRLSAVLGVRPEDLMNTPDDEVGTEGEFWRAMRGVGHLAPAQKEALYQALTAVVRVATGDLDA